MKKILIAMLLLNVAGVSLVRAADTASPNTLVWCGLDYSKVKMIGTLTSMAMDPTTDMITPA